MARAYKFSDFVKFFDKPDRLAEQINYKTEYNQIMKSPVREVQFFIRKANSAYVPPDIEKYKAITITSPEYIEIDHNAERSLRKETSVENDVKTTIFYVPQSMTGTFNMTFYVFDPTMEIDTLTVNGLDYDVPEQQDYSTRFQLTIFGLKEGVTNATINVGTKARTVSGYSLTFNFSNSDLYTTTEHKPSSVIAKTTDNSKIYTIPYDALTGGEYIKIILDTDNSHTHHPAITGYTGTITYTSSVDVANRIVLNITAISSNVTFNVTEVENGGVEPDPGEDNRSWNDITVAHGYRWTETSGELVYDGLASANNRIYALEFPFIPNANYRFRFENGVQGNSGHLYPSGVYVAAKNIAIGPNEKDNGTTGYKLYSLSADTTTGFVTWEFPTTDQLTGRYIRMCFFNFPQGSKPILAKAQAFYDSDSVSPDSSYEGGISGVYFDGEDVVSVDITLETDVLCRETPYSEYTVVLNDDKDVFNPLSKSNLLKNFTKYQDFEFYTLCHNADEPLSDWYITQIGCAKLNDIKSSNMTATLTFIGLMEYYDNIYLSDTELFYSSHFNTMRIKDYLMLLFGSDIDEYSIDDLTEEILTPFESESKLEILRIIAEYVCGYVHENEYGQLAIKRLVKTRFYNETTIDDPFKLSLDYQTTNPDYKEVHELPDDYNISLYSYVDDDQRVDLMEPSNDLVVFDFFTKDNGSGNDPEGYVYQGSYNITGDTESGILSGKDQWLKNIIEDENLKFLKIRLRFDKAYSLDSMLVQNFFGDAYFAYFGDAPTEKINIYQMEKFTNIMFTNEDGVSTGGVKVCEHYVDFWREKVGTTQAEIERGRIRRITAYNFVDEENYLDNEEILCDNENFLYWLIFTVPFCFYNTTAKAVKTNMLSCKLKDELSLGRSQKEIELDNPLITNMTRLLYYHRYYTNIYDNYRYEIDVNSWLGNANIVVSNKILCGFAKNNTNKTFENYYTGIVKRKQINYDGGYSEDITLASYPQKLYQKEIYHANTNTYSSVDNPIANGAYTNSDIALKAGSGFRFELKSDINL